MTFKIPKAVMGLGGLIKVKVVLKPIKYKGEKCAGTWNPANRTILLAKASVREMRHTYFHELLHAAVSDSGLTNLLSEDAEEALADLVGTARVRELDEL